MSPPGKLTRAHAAAPTPLRTTFTCRIGVGRYNLKNHHFHARKKGPAVSEFIPEDLFVDDPVFSVRWRLQNRALPLKNRHLRAFSESGVSRALASWARQHIEWTLAEGTAQAPNGVLILAVDDQGRAVMAAEPYEPFAPLTATGLAERTSAQRDQPMEGEVIWIARAEGSELVALTSEDKPLSGTNSLVVDLAKTLGTPVRFVSRDVGGNELIGEIDPSDEVFLVSDEHGVQASSDHAGPISERFAAYYARLVGLAKPDAHDCMNLGIR